MKKRYILLLLFCLVLVGASAQTLEQAKAFYNKGQYEKPNPFLKKFVGHNRQNENYNLLVRCMCLETGELYITLKYLENTFRKRSCQRTIVSGTKIITTCIVLKMPSECYEEYIQDSPA